MYRSAFKCIKCLNLPRVHRCFYDPAKYDIIPNSYNYCNSCLDDIIRKTKVEFSKIYENEPTSEDQYIDLLKYYCSHNYDTFGYTKKPSELRRIFDQIYKYNKPKSLDHQERRWDHFKKNYTSNSEEKFLNYDDEQFLRDTPATMYDIYQLQRENEKLKKIINSHNL